ncbi:MAG: ComF family protein [Akkermansia sp.]|nr:ComF family protein [Akkermansia sp.]
MLSWLYPIVCECCGEPSERSICPGCLAKFPRLPRPICLHCGTHLSYTPPAPDACHACTGKPRPFALVRSALAGTADTMELVYRLKFHRCAYLADGMAAAMAELWSNTPELTDWQHATLVPVPVTPTHLSQRGYNQAEELARALGKQIDRPVACPLHRRETEHSSQIGLSARQRALNAYKAFHAAPAYTAGRASLPSHVVLIDDVYTTGSTARACARALRHLPGVKAVAVLTFARALLD